MRTAVKVKITILVLAVGIALCIAGVFVAPLLIPGGIIISAALTMLGTTLSARNPASEPPTPEHVATPAPTPQIVSHVPVREHIEHDLNVFLTFRGDAHGAKDMFNRSQERLSGELRSYSPQIILT